MAEDDLHIETMRIGTATGDGVDVGELSNNAVNGCAELVAELLRHMNTRPGPDEEIEIQLVRRRLPDAAREAMREMPPQMRDIGRRGPG